MIATLPAAQTPSADRQPAQLARLELEFVRQAPFLPGAFDLAAATSAVAPWPHQLSAVRRAVSRFPEGFLFCDEVGLGKTVEAGLALRSLWISLRVRRALLLVPAALLRQWQEELHEKFALDALVFSGDRFVDVHGRERTPDTTRRGDDDSWHQNSWNHHDLVLASTQLARRAERRRQLLHAEPWDLVIVDEAHHARRRDPGSEGYRPNRLLELLAGRAGAEPAGLVRRSRCLWLLTATPMQIHPQEFWDLLALLGVRTPEQPSDRTEVRRRVLRQTRQVLRRYRDQGLLDAGVPVRRPQNVWIELGDEASRVYRRIETYLSLFYRRYEAERRGLGFVMTVYRRRLTSSFEAIRRSLLRRRARLRAGEPGADELEHLDGFLDQLAALDVDPKVERLRADLRRLLAERDRALVFTQYLDTLDHLREVLSPDWRVACWSGRGGEVRDGDAWVAVGKEELKAAFGRGDVQVLLATDAASEGLNLQSCGVLVHFDLPWNPMRVEQRIGRLDRIGQVHDEIWIRSYFYAGTVEAEVYRRLADRIRWFEETVGSLQPILQQVGETLEEIAMLPPERRQRPLEEKLHDLGRQVEEQKAAASWQTMLDDDEPADDDDGALALAAPLTPADVESIVLRADAGNRLTPVRSQAAAAETSPSGIYDLVLDGRSERVTFRPEVYDAHPYSTRLLTWGVPRFERLLDELAGGAADDESAWSREHPGGVGLYRSERPAPVALFLHPGGDAASLGQLRGLARDAPAAWRPDEEAEVASRFSALRRRALRTRERIEEERRRAERRALREASAHCLVRLALLELIEAENPGLFDAPLPWGFGVRAVREQARHGEPLDDLVARLERDDALPAARADDPFYVEARGHRRGWRERRRRLLLERAGDCLRRTRALDEAEAEARRRQEEPSAGLLGRRWLRLGTRNEPARTLLDATEIAPFVDAVPALGDLDDAAVSLVDAAEEGRDLLAELAARPDGAQWLRDARASSRRFAARIDGDDLAPKAAAGSWLLFEAERQQRAWRPGDLYLLRVDGQALVRRIESQANDDGVRLVLSAEAAGSTVVVEDPEPDTVVVLARFVGTV